MRQYYHKLIRDKIPEIIEQTGKEFETAVYDDTMYRQALRHKLIEEAEEVISAETRDDIIKELADLSEIIDAIVQSEGIGWNEVTAVQTQRRQDRGAFGKRLQLLWVEE